MSHDFCEEIDRLLALKSGRLEGQGEALDPEAAERVRAWLDEFAKHVPHLIRVYPTRAGGIQAEWTAEPLVWDVEFDRKGTRVEVGGTNPDTMEDYSLTLDVTDKCSAVRAGAFVQVAPSRESLCREHGELAEKLVQYSISDDERDRLITVRCMLDRYGDAVMGQGLDALEAHAKAVCAARSA